MATVDEAMALRAAGDTGRVLCWLTVPGEDYADPRPADVDVTAYTVAALDEIAAAARSPGSRPGCSSRSTPASRAAAATVATWPELVAAARAGEAAGTWRVTGIWSHFACSDEPDHPANDAQERAFQEALAVAEAAGLAPEVRHLANSAGALLRPSSRFDLVRCGLALYGLDPAPGHTPDLGLRPAMTARAALAMVKPVATGAGVSYGHTWAADHETTLGLVPLGYGDGVPRHAGNTAETWVAGKRRPVRGRICMDQFVVDLGGELPGRVTRWCCSAPGSGGAHRGGLGAACGTIPYEIVTRIGGRMTRRHVDTEADGEVLG